MSAKNEEWNFKHELWIHIIKTYYIRVFDPNLGIFSIEIWFIDFFSGTFYEENILCDTQIPMLYIYGWYTEILGGNEIVLLNIF